MFLSFGSPKPQGLPTLSAAFPRGDRSRPPGSGRRHPVSSRQNALLHHAESPSATPRRIAVCALPPLCVAVHSSRCFPSSAILILVPTSRRRRRPYLGVAAHLRVHVPIQERGRRLDLQQHHLRRLLD